MSKWVQHISGQGEKWEVFSELPDEWRVVAKKKVIGDEHFIPKSEYVECDPPEQWEDVTAECEWVQHAYYDINPVWAKEWHIRHQGRRVESFPKTYCLRKVQLYDEDAHLHQTKRWAFIVERKKS